MSSVRERWRHTCVVAVVVCVMRYRGHLQQHVDSAEEAELRRLVPAAEEEQSVRAWVCVCVFYAVYVRLFVRTLLLEGQEYLRRVSVSGLVTRSRPDVRRQLSAIA